MPIEDSKPKTETPGVPSSPETITPPASTAHRRRKVILIAITGIIILIIGIPAIIRVFNTVSTNDAYVNSHVTFVAPRVPGQVAQVLVDDNNRVKKGDVLVELDPEPYKVQVAIKEAAVKSAEADLVVAKATIRGLVAQMRSQRFMLSHAIEDVDNQVALLRQRVATWEQSKATLALAQTEFDRAKKLLAGKVVSTEEFDKKREALDVANSQVTQALENIHQARAALGLPTVQPEGANPADVPANIDQTFSSVLQALAGLYQSASHLGVTASSFELTPNQTIAEFHKRDPSGNLDVIYEKIMKDAPGLKQAEAAVLRTQRDLDQAKLDLSYCTIKAEIDGVVTRRNVNPGNNVLVGQSLMAIRSLREIWVDANFKETQLRDLRIGQHVDLELDMYGGKKKFDGRISGFTMGTGSTLALLPAQNATGNFVKVVQRLPVRIDLINYDPDKLPLFVGLSVTPTVDLKTPPSGPDAGKFLQQSTAPAAAASPSPAK